MSFRTADRLIMTAVMAGTSLFRSWPSLCSTEQQEPANPVEMIEETSGGNVEIDIPEIFSKRFARRRRKGAGERQLVPGIKQDARLQDTGVQRRSQPAFARIESQGQRERHCGEISKIQGTGLYFLKRSELVCPCRQLPKPGGSGVRACRTEAGIPQFASEMIVVRSRIVVGNSSADGYPVYAKMK